MRFFSLMGNSFGCFASLVNALFLLQGDELKDCWGPHGGAPRPGMPGQPPPTLPGMPPPPGGQMQLPGPPRPGMPPPLNSQQQQQ
ncbi:hypothetical protein M8C21_017735 [Ambrosia artemisiifolia]|uniref:Uncharacterized protein n=1 Tax=Ambrosia artemisiifolia TaxID=4212 RepID=A0AAD5D1Z6_AMBAR|nr:hypothetical protein M8C21_017735 [Ambrosia artemisiifolia]